MRQQCQRVAVADVQVGMFVSGLDTPMHRTPFPVQGFYVRNQDDKDQLAFYCSYVDVNVKKSEAARLADSGTFAKVSESDNGSLYDPAPKSAKYELDEVEWQSHSQALRKISAAELRRAKLRSKSQIAEAAPQWSPNPGSVAVPRYGSLYASRQPHKLRKRKRDKPSLPLFKILVSVAVITYVMWQSNIFALQDRFPFS